MADVNLLAGPDNAFLKIDNRYKISDQMNFQPAETGAK